MTGKTQPVQEPGELYHQLGPLWKGFLVEVEGGEVHQEGVAVEVHLEVEVEEADLLWLGLEQSC